MTRLRGIDRARSAGWAIALAIAAAAWWINRRTPLVVAAPPCAGAGEWLAMALTRLAPHQSLGAIVRTIDVASDALAIALLTRLATLASRSLIAGAAIGLACARLFAFVPVYAVSDSLAIAVAAATVLALQSRHSRQAGVRDVSPYLGLAASVAIAGVVPGSTCLSLPAGPATTGQHLAASLHASFATLSPLVIGLAVLGAVTIALDGDRDVSVAWLASYAAGAIVLSAFSTASPARLLAPLLVAAIFFASAGLRAFRTAILTPETWARRVMEAAVLLAVAFVHVPTSIAPPLPIADDPLGVDRLSRAQFESLRRALPPGAVLVDDDALERMLAVSSGTPSVEAAPDVLRDALARGPVVALPPAQAALVHEGFSLQPVDAVGVTGLTTIAANGECASVHGGWRDAAGLTGAASIALVAPSADARGPVVSYLGATSPFLPAPRGWPAIATRGWYATAYERANADQARALASDMASDGVPADLGLADAPYVARLELWRVPDAPLILDVALGTTSNTAIVHANNPSDPAHVLLCPSAPVTLQPLRVQR